jgi:exodeoxyribonuclease VII large subunit
VTPGASAAPDPAPTWSVSELHEAVEGILEHVFGAELWVEGELRNISRSARGHVYFDLVDPTAPSDASRPMLAVTLFDSDRQAVNQFLKRGSPTAQGGAVRMVDGVRVRIRGRLGTYAVRSTLQLRMTWIDPAFTLGVLGQERERVLAALLADDLLEANARVPLPVAPLRVALITSRGSAAHADALDELRRSGLGFEVTVVDARTQGVDAERSLVRALRVATQREVDAVALVRGGGARTDLAAFDSELVARAIAAARVPVLTGIGHEIDRTVADEVAHRAHKTPTACAASLVEAVRAAASEVHDAWVRVSSAGDGRLVRADHDLDRARRDAARGAIRHLERDAQRISNLAGRVVVAAPRVPVAAAGALDTASGRLVPAARQRTRRAEESLASLAARARSHDPQRALARGWSITRSADGALVRDPAELPAGATVTTTVAQGTFTSTVEAGADGEGD